MATIALIIPQAFISHFKGNTVTVHQLLNNIFALPGEDNQLGNAKLICDELVKFHEDGSPVVNVFELEDELIYDPATKKGKLVLKYRVDFHFGCSDLSPSENATERCDFNIDLDNSKLHLHIHDPIRRDTVDEF